MEIEKWKCLRLTDSGYVKNVEVSGLLRGDEMRKDYNEQDWGKIEKWTTKERLEFLCYTYSKYAEGDLKKGLFFASHCLNCAFGKELNDYWRKKNAVKE